MKHCKNCGKRLTLNKCEKLSQTQKIRRVFCNNKCFRESQHAQTYASRVLGHQHNRNIGLVWDGIQYRPCFEHNGKYYLATMYLHKYCKGIPAPIRQWGKAA